jgi:hypothetical protein
VQYFVGRKSADESRAQFLRVHNVHPEWTVGELVASALPQLGLRGPDDRVVTVLETDVYNVDRAATDSLINATADMLCDKVALDAMLQDVAPKRPSDRISSVYLLVDVPSSVASSSKPLIGMLLIAIATISWSCHHHS